MSENILILADSALAVHGPLHVLHRVKVKHSTYIHMMAERYQITSWIGRMKECSLIVMEP